MGNDEGINLGEGKRVLVADGDEGRAFGEDVEYKISGDGGDGDSDNFFKDNFNKNLGAYRGRDDDDAVLAGVVLEELECSEFDYWS